MEFWAQNLGAWFRSPFFNICMYDILFLFVLEQSRHSQLLLMQMSKVYGDS